MTTQKDNLREDFKANFLDGDEIQAGQMLASTEIWEWIEERFTQALERVETEIIDKWVAQVMEDIYPLDVFHKTTKEDREKLNKSDDILHTRAHVTGIYHGLHILRREVRGLSARDDLDYLPQETSEYYAQLRQSERTE